MTDIYLVIMDCLRYDMIDMEIDGQPLMPVLKAFKEGSLSFRNSFASAPSTHFAVPTILTGTLPFTTDDKQGIDKDVPYMPRILKDKGFRTLGYTTNIVTSSIYGYSRSFDRYRDFLTDSDVKPTYKLRKKFAYFLERLSPKKRSFFDTILFPFFKLTGIFGWELNPQNTNFEMNDMMDGVNIIKALARDLEDISEERSFSFLHFVDTHAPYAPPEEYMEGLVDPDKRTRKFLKSFFQMVYKEEGSVLSNPELKRLNRNLYLSSCRYQDKLFRDLLTLLRDREIEERSTIIVMADHGEAFGEHGYLQHRRTRHNGEHIRIPVLIKGKGIAPGEVEGLLDETDILPIVKRLAEGRGLEDIIERINERRRIVTLGYSNTASLTSRKVRFINDDEGMKLFLFDDVEEKEPQKLDKGLSRYFMDQIRNVRKEHREGLSERTLLSSSIKRIKTGDGKKKM